MTSPVPGLADVITAIQGLTDELKAVRGELKAVKQSARISKRVIAGLIVSLCLDLLITAGFGYNTVQARNASDQATKFADQLHDNNLDACRAGNGRLAQQRQALDAILSQVPPRNAAERALVAKDETFVEAGWSPRDCARVYPLPPGR